MPALESTAGRPVMGLADVQMLSATRRSVPAGTRGSSSVARDPRSAVLDGVELSPESRRRCADRSAPWREPLVPAAGRPVLLIVARGFRVPQRERTSLYGLVLTAALPLPEVQPAPARPRHDQIEDHPLDAHGAAVWRRSGPISSHEGLTVANQGRQVTS